MRNLDKLVSNTADGSCYIESLWFLSVANNQYNGGLEDFMIEGYQNGDFGQKRNGDYKYDWVNSNENYITESFSGSFDSKKIDQLAGDNQYAMVRIDRSARGNNQYGTHYSLIGKNGKDWMSYEHDDKTNNRGFFQWRNNKPTWNLIRKIYFP